MKFSDSVLELKTIEAAHVRKQAQQRLQDAINQLQRSVYDIEVYGEKLEAAQDDKERAQVVNWAINHLVCNILPNFRIDLLATSQAELTAAGK
jgi:ABC-type phosphate transport system ATPase subunit